MGKRSTTLSEAVADYLRYQEARGFAQNTLIGSNMVLQQFVRYTGDKQIANVTEKHVYDYFYGPGGLMSRRRTAIPNYERWSDPLSPSSHNLYRTRLRAFFAWARSQGLVKGDPVGQIHPMKVPARKRTRPSPEVLLSLLDQAPDARDRAFLAMAMNTGMRSSEIVEIKVGDLDLDAGYIDVTIRKTGDIDEQPVTNDLDRELRAWLTEYASGVSRPLRADDFLFPKRTGKLFGPLVENEDGEIVQSRTAITFHPRIKMSSPHVVVQRALKAVGLPTTYEGVHTIRRAAARAYYDYLVDNGERDISALRMTQALLHHKTLATTERYIGIDTERVKRDRSLRGRDFLVKMANVEAENVVPLRRKSAGE